MDWKAFWQDYRIIKIKSEKDLLYQVGKTVGGEVISESQFQLDLKEIKENLNLSKEDVLLDLCCGNGVLTKRISFYVGKVIGLDFSKEFIRNAKRYSSAVNIEYHAQDILNQSSLMQLLDSKNCNKVLLNDCLAYFNPKSFSTILDVLSKYEVDVLCMSVLDHNKKWHFYNTLYRKWSYFKEKVFIKNKSGLGYWWKQSQLIQIANRFGFKCLCFGHHSDNHTSHYRFNVKLEK